MKKNTITLVVLSLILPLALLQAGSCGTAASTTKAAYKSKVTANIVETAVSAGSFNTLVAAVKAAGLVETLSGEGPFTVFAPTDAAFSALPAGTVESLLLPENKEKLVAILTYHVVPAKVKAKDVKSGEAPTVNGKTLTIDASASGVTVEGAKVIKTDVMASNGVIHVVDTVILP